ncbi:hypothetical protein TNCV_3442321 [Trichonephila clavipes]|nr:hypothetical protein TNCV_3442321 [Trichonephila clavipes]
MVSGRGSLVVKVTDSWPACHEFELCTAEDQQCTEGRCTLNKSRLKRPPVVHAGEGDTNSSVVLVTYPRFKITRTVAKSPRVVEQCDVNIHSLTGMMAKIKNGSH